MSTEMPKSTKETMKMKKTGIQMKNNMEMRMGVNI